MRNLTQNKNFAILCYPIHDKSLDILSEGIFNMLLNEFIVIISQVFYKLITTRFFTENIRL